MVAPAYIPDVAENPTVFPLARRKDFDLAARKVKEQWARFYPQVSYRRINVIPTALWDPAEGEAEECFDSFDKPSGINTGGTLVDPLYEETLPEGQLDRWLQPHSTVESPERNADKHNRYMEPVPVHAFIRVEVNEFALKRWGIEEMFDIIAIFNTPELDERKILIAAGDRFLWQGQEYEVHQRKPNGWWMNTDLFFHLVANCKRVRLGS